MCALVVNKKGWEKKNPEEKLRRLPLWTKSKRRKEALSHIRKRKRNRTPLPPLKENYAWSDGGKLQRKRRTRRKEQEGRAAGWVDGCWWVRTDVERKQQRAG